MSALSQQQVEQFQEQGFLKVEGVLDPATYLDPVIDEYAGVLNSTPWPRSCSPAARYLRLTTSCRSASG